MIQPPATWTTTMCSSGYGARATWQTRFGYPLNRQKVSLGASVRGTLGEGRVVEMGG